jgi:hypothetical protein
VCFLRLEGNSQVAVKKYSAHMMPTIFPIDLIMAFADAPDPTHLSEPVTPQQKKILFRRASSVVTPGSGGDFATLDEIEEKSLKEAAISARKQVTVCAWLFARKHTSRWNLNRCILYNLIRCAFRL